MIRSNSSTETQIRSIYSSLGAKREISDERKGRRHASKRVQRYNLRHPAGKQFLEVVNFFSALKKNKTAYKTLEVAGAWPSK